jgi:hypothetical protein
MENQCWIYTGLNDVWMSKYSTNENILHSEKIKYSRKNLISLSVLKKAIYNLFPKRKLVLL